MYTRVKKIEGFLDAMGRSKHRIIFPCPSGLIFVCFRSKHIPKIRKKCQSTRQIRRLENAENKTIIHEMEFAKLTSDDPLMPSMYPGMYSLQPWAKPASLSGPGERRKAKFTACLSLSYLPLDVWCRQCVELMTLKRLCILDWNSLHVVMQWMRMLLILVCRAVAEQVKNQPFMLYKVLVLYRNSFCRTQTRREMSLLHFICVLIFNNLWSARRLPQSFHLEKFFLTKNISMSHCIKNIPVPIIAWRFDTLWLWYHIQIDCYNIFVWLFLKKCVIPILCNL